MHERGVMNSNSDFVTLLTVLTVDKAKEAKEKEGKGFASQ
jgi:hypothetical protein